MTTIFWLIRHGETRWNSERRLQGWRDIPLNSIGIFQAQCLSARLRPPFFTAPIGQIFSSDLARARQTAEIAATYWDLPIISMPALRERHFGFYEGQFLDSLQDDAGIPIGFHALDQGMQGGESLSAFRERVRQVINQLACMHPDQHLLLFSHGGVLDMIWRLAMNAGFPSDPIPLLKNTSISQLQVNADETWEIGIWGSSAHLADNDSSSN